MQLLVNPSNLTVKRVTITDDNIVEILNDRSPVKVEYFKVVKFNGNTFYVDEEGKLKRNSHILLPGLYPEPLAGNIIIETEQNLIIKDFIYLLGNFLMLNGAKLWGIKANDAAYERGFKSSEELKLWIKNSK